MKKVRTIRIDKDVSDSLDSICIRHGDVSWHIERALRGYGPIKQLTRQPTADPPVAKGISPTPIMGGWVEGDRLFELFWLAGMKKTNKKKAKPLFLTIIKKAGPTYEEATTTMLIGDIQKRLNSNQLGFAEMHPTTYLNGERWNDEVINHENTTGTSQSNRYETPADRSRAAAQGYLDERAIREGNDSIVGSHAGDLRAAVGEQQRINPNENMGEIIDGNFTRSDS